MNDMPRKEIIDSLKREYPKGTRVELIGMNDPYDTKLKSGDKGTVVCVDSMGTIFVNWDCGSKLGVAYGEDHIKKISNP